MLSQSWKRLLNKIIFRVLKKDRGDSSCFDLTPIKINVSHTKTLRICPHTSRNCLCLPILHIFPAHFNVSIKRSRNEIIKSWVVSSVHVAFHRRYFLQSWCARDFLPKFRWKYISFICFSICFLSLATLSSRVF